MICRQRCCSAGNILQVLDAPLICRFVQSSITAEAYTHKLGRLGQFFENGLPTCGVKSQASQNVRNIGMKADLPWLNQTTLPVDQLQVTRERNAPHPSTACSALPLT